MAPFNTEWDARQLCPSPFGQPDPIEDMAVILSAACPWEGPTAMWPLEVIFESYQGPPYYVRRC